jgi:anion-transporting  ArsA/GET3 family ATPase
LTAALPDVCDRRLILVVGKGGVGRSTVAAALAHECARRGRNTLLFASNANDRFASLLAPGHPPVSTDIVELAPRLSAVNTTPAAAIAEYGLMILRFKSVYEMVFENRISKAFLRAVPGLDDYAVLGKCWFHTTQEQRRGQPLWDTVIFDMPASGHAASMLKVPMVIVDTVPDGPLTRDARTILALVRDPARTAAVLVTLAEEMPVNEACELETKLVSFGIAPQRIACNQVYPEYFAAGSPVTRVVDALAGAQPALASPLAELASHAELARSRRALNARYLAELRRRAATPVGELPMLFASRFGRAQVETLATAFARPSS